MAEKEKKMKEKIDTIENGFFKHVSVDDDLEAIKARGANTFSAEEEKAQTTVAQKAEAKAETVELVAGQNYNLDLGDGQKISFQAEAGGIIGTADANGSIQGGKLVLTAFGKEYEGSFTSATQANITWKSIEKADETG